MSVPPRPTATGIAEVRELAVRLSKFTQKKPAETFKGSATGNLLYRGNTIMSLSAKFSPYFLTPRRLQRGAR